MRSFDFSFNGLIKMLMHQMNKLFINVIKCEMFFSREMAFIFTPCQ